MSNGSSASPKPAGTATTRPVSEGRPRRWLQSGPAEGPALGRHTHHCVSCGAAYECRGPTEIGYCAPVCQPCHWIELGTQLRVYKEVVTELERRRSGIERRIGKEACQSAAARRRKMRNNRASLLVAFGNVLSAPPALGFTRLNSETQEGGSDE
jgi:hypothetical protein